MAIYSYKGLDRTGKEVKATVNADNVTIAKQRVKSQGIMLTEIKEQSSSSSKNSFVGSVGKQVNINDLSLMTRQLATLIKARIQIVEALAALMDQIDNPTLKIILSELRQKVNEGSSLAKGLADYPKVFNSVYINMVEAGEASGNLDVVLLRLADFTEAQVKLKNKIKGAMTYPIIMLVMGLLMVNVIFIFVIPKIAKVFNSMKKELPLQTKICISISEFMVEYWPGVLVGTFVFIYIFRKYLQSQRGIQRWHKIQLKLPLLGQLVKMINVGRFCSTLATLLNSGVPILASLNIVKNLIPNIYMRQAIEDARVSVSEGNKLDVPLAQSGYFPPMVTHMIRLGEQSGELEPMLQIVAENYDDQVQTKIEGLTSTLEPIMMVVMGGIVGFIVFSVVVPMMDINSPT